MIQSSPFLRKGKVHSFIHFLLVFCLYKALHDRTSMSSHFLFFYRSRGISSTPAVFYCFYFFTASSSSSTSFMSSWLSIIFSWFNSNVRIVFKQDSSNVLSTSYVVRLGLQPLFALSMCFSFRLFHFSSTMIIMIVYLLQNFWF